MSQTIFPMVLLPRLGQPKARFIARKHESKVSPAVTSLSRPGALLANNLQYMLPDNQRGGYLKAFLMELGGVAGRFYVKDYSYRQQGSFPGSELSPARVIFGTGADHTGAAFQTGIAGASEDWQASDAAVTLSSDGVYMRTVNASGGNHRITPGSDASVSVSPYVPHVVRCFKRPGPVDYQTIGTINIGTVAAGTDLLSQQLTVDGMNNGVFEAPGAGNQSVFPSIILNFSGNFSPRELSIGYYSIQQCALVDSAPNLILYSNDFSQSDYTLDGVTESTATTLGPRGTESIGRLTEDSSTGLHDIEQSVAKPAVEGPIGFAAYVDANGRDFVRLNMSTTGRTSFAIFDLSTGVVQSVQDSAGSNDPRALIEDLGNGWYRCFLAARMANDATVDCAVQLQSNSTTISYTGDGASGVQLFGLSVSEGWHPVRYNETTSAAATELSQSGLVLRVKGLPPSTQGLLRTGDCLEINQSYQYLTQDMNSDGMGNAILAISPGLRTIPASNDPVVIGQPLMYCMTESNDPGWQVRPPVQLSAQVPILEGSL